MSSAEIAVQIFRKLENEDFRVLQVIETGMSQHEFVPKEQVARFAHLDLARERILLLLRDDDLRNRFSRAAREDIAREASIERMFSGFRECVDALADPGSELCVRRYP